MSDQTVERRRRGRGVTRAADRAPDRAALAPDQGAGRVRADVLHLLRRREDTSTTSWSGPTCSRRRLAGEGAPRLHARARIPVHADQGRGLRRGLPRLPGDREQIYKFVAPGLYKNERQAFLPYLVATPVLFTVGAVGRLLHRHADADALLGRHAAARDRVDARPSSSCPKVSEYLSLIMTLIFAFGICFQLPVVLTLLARAGHHRFAVPQGQAALRHRRRLRPRRRADAARRDQPVRACGPDVASLRGVHPLGPHGREEARGSRGRARGGRVGRPPDGRQVPSAIGARSGMPCGGQGRAASTVRPMHDIRCIRENAAAFDQGLWRTAGLAPLSAHADRPRRPPQGGDLRPRRPPGAPQRALQGDRPGEGRRRTRRARRTLMAEVARLKEERAAARGRRSARPARRSTTRSPASPTLPKDDVPVGADEHANVERHRFGETPRNLTAPGSISRSAKPSA